MKMSDLTDAVKAPNSSVVGWANGVNLVLSGSRHRRVPGNGYEV